jgi:hypothetical protein
MDNDTRGKGMEKGFNAGLTRTFQNGGGNVLTSFKKSHLDLGYVTTNPALFMCCIGDKSS